MLKHTQQHKKMPGVLTPGTKTQQTTHNYEENSLLSFFLEIKSITTLAASLIKGAR